MNDWYPSGVPGAGTDTIQSLGPMSLPYVCGHPLGLAQGYETIEHRSSTIASGRVETELVQTFTHGDTILCTIDNKIAIIPKITTRTEAAPWPRLSAKASRSAK